MLRRAYGIAVPSSLTPVAHPEDAQPNEAINKRAQKLPPVIRNTAPPPQATSTHYRGGFRGRGGYHNRGGGNSMSQRGQWTTQHATRGNLGWRGRGMYGNRGDRSNGNGNAPVYRDAQGRPFHGLPPKPIGREELSSSSSTSSSSSYSAQRAKSVDMEMEAGPSSSSAAGRHAELSMPIHSSQTPASPPAPERPHRPTADSWMHRSRSPTPKLPLLPPLKRRKLDHPAEPPRHHEDLPRRSISIEASSSSSLMPPPPSVPRLPLPGSSRRKEPTTTPTIAAPNPHIQIKEETLSPIKPEFPDEQPVKRETLSLSPERSMMLLSAPKLIKEATKFYEFPASCGKADKDYKQHRVAFFRERKKELGGLGLKIRRIVARDDGLAIDWYATPSSTI
ncbi:hypothetical protein GALMADRAFT_1076048 [Galerina marginata CBS 339.88]|uniref:Uncharacterized protein n=1 Tax=Galerina marginata (strain CBS 339.88) TaxID=685588 RepID=A0A067SJ32_GALM3|nr:hypothetical protein GALMADRAFT_1076048 [Galerina marginata CBS 339.88]